MATVETAGERSSSAAYVALVFGAVLMGTSPILVRLAEVGPFASAFWRVALSLPILWAWDRSQRTPEEPAISWPLVLAGLAFAGDLTFWHLAILKTTVANATFFATTAPVWVVVISWIFLRQRARPQMVGGLLLAIVGGTALLGESFALAPDRLAGDFFGIVTAFFFGCYFIFVQKARGTSSSAHVLYVSTIMTSAILLVVALAAGESFLPATANGAAALVALALISHTGGQGLLAYALGTLPVAFSSLVIFLEAIAAAGFAWLLLGEDLTWLQLLGGAVIVTGIWIARPGRSDR